VARLTPVDPRVVDRVLRKLGFARVRQRGSHVFYRHPDGRTTTVPHHKGRDLAVPLLRAILADIQIAPDDFLRLLRSCETSANDRKQPRHQDGRSAAGPPHA
jgi:predicted RNA binding protein YcfA (HicA-like mRNA interferase family)